MRSVDATKVERAAPFGNDTRRGQRRKVDDTHVRHLLGAVEEGNSSRLDLPRGHFQGVVLNATKPVLKLMECGGTCWQVQFHFSPSPVCFTATVPLRVSQPAGMTGLGLDPCDATIWNIFCYFPLALAPSIFMPVRCAKVSLCEEISMIVSTTMLSVGQPWRAARALSPGYLGNRVMLLVCLDELLEPLDRPHYRDRDSRRQNSA